MEGRLQFSFFFFLSERWLVVEHRNFLVTSEEENRHQRERERYMSI